MRRLFNLIALTLSTGATLFGLFWLVWILFTTLANGLPALKLDLFTKMTPPPGSDGGLLNAFYGSALMIFIAVAVGTPIGIAAGTYLSEYARDSALGRLTRFINDVL